MLTERKREELKKRLKGGTRREGVIAGKGDYLFVTIFSLETNGPRPWISEIILLPHHKVGQEFC